MKKTCRICLSITIVMLLALLCAHPAIAEEYADEVYETEVRMNEYSLAWGNGIDDDGDGVIDNWGEADVEEGTVTVDPDNTTTDTWYGNFTYPNPLEDGVAFDAYIDEIMEIYSNTNISLTPSQTCYYTNTSYGYTNFSSYDTVSNVINVATFYVNLSPGDVMNGAQEIWYRSPLVWNDEDNGYEEHYLNVYNEDNVLVYASPLHTSPSGSRIYSEPQPKFVTDDSAIDGIGGERVYYKMNFNFRTEKRYRFEEYVTTEDDNPINSVKLYMARAQDIGRDGETNTYVFKGTDYARKIPMECSWSAICTIGIGRAGTEGVVFGDDGTNQTIYTSKIQGDPESTDVKSATFIFPLRTTKALDVCIGVRTWSGGSSTSWSTIGPLDEYDSNIHGATGTLIFSTNISDPDPSEPNEYQLFFTFRNLNDGDAMLYTMYPEEGALHTTSDWNGHTNTSVKHFATHVEIVGESGSYVSGSQEERTQNTPDLAELLVGIGLIIAGIVLTAFVVTAEVGIPLMAAGVACGIASIGTGSLMAFHSFSDSAGLENFPTWLSDGVIRAGKTVIEGVSHVAGALWDVTVQTMERIVEIGKAVLYYAAAILLPIADIIWFLAFLLVVWFWAKFLNIMKYIALADLEGATGAVKATTQSIRRPISRIRRR